MPTLLLSKTCRILPQYSENIAMLKVIIVENVQPKLFD